MEKNSKRALIISLVDRLRQVGSWCGETHIQKSCYALQTLFGVPFGFNFILYKHGPFSFDMQEQISEPRADDLLKIVPTNFNYGSSYASTDSAKKIVSIRENVVEEYSTQIQFIADKLGKKKVSELEKLATAIFVTEEMDTGCSAEVRAKKLTEYKKHVPFDEALIAVKEQDSLRAQMSPTT